MPSENLNGFDMHYEVAGEGEPLILLHGFTGSSADWRHVLPEPPNGFRTIAVDLRGHGASTNPGGEFGFRQCGRDVLALLDRLGIDRFKAIGLSGGGITILHAATQAPARVEAMVVVSATPYFPAPARAIMGQLTVETRSAEEWAFMRASHKHGDDQIRALWQHGNALKDSYDDVAFTPPLLATISARTLVVHGDRDPLYPLQSAVDLANGIPGSHLWIVPNGSHMPVFGPLTAAFVATSLAFLRREWEG